MGTHVKFFQVQKSKLFKYDIFFEAWVISADTCLVGFFAEKIVSLNFKLSGRISSHRSDGYYHKNCTGRIDKKASFSVI